MAPSTGKVVDGATKGMEGDERDDDSRGIGQPEHPLRDCPGLVGGFGGRADRPPAETTEVRQVHGRDVIDADALPAGTLDIEADALFVTRPGRIVAVRTADCVPVLLWSRDPSRPWAAAVHAGWRGTIADIVMAAVDCALSGGVAVGRLAAAIGPAIGPCCYEVGDELARRFAAAGHPVERRGGRPALDLAGINERLLTRRGLIAVERVGGCTRCQPHRYHSFRRDGEAAGRQHSWIGWARRTP
jgi:YfiH family protein